MELQDFGELIQGESFDDGLHGWILVVAGWEELRDYNIESDEECGGKLEGVGLGG